MMSKSSSVDLLKKAFEAVRGRLGAVTSHTLPAGSNCHLLATNHAQYIFDNTLFGGKHSRARLAIDTFDALRKDTPQEKRLQFAQAAVAIEMVQTFYLILDDIMDSSETRRGQLCWYRRPEIGFGAVNDALLLEVLVEEILDDALGGHQNLERIKDAFRKSKRDTVVGQLLDWKSQRDFTNFSWDRYEAIVGHKTSNYTLWLPIQIGLLGADQCADMEMIKDFCYRVGFLFQSQDDFLDVYGDSKITGKVGTDIQDGKCSWLSVRVMQLLEKKEELRQVFMTSYGSLDPSSVQRAHSLFDELKMKAEFENFEMLYSSQLLNDLQNVHQPLQPVFKRIIEKLIGRDK